MAEDIYPEYSLMSVTELVQVMAALENEIEKQSQISKALNVRYDHLRLRVIPDRCEVEGIDGLRVKGTGTLVLTSDIYASIVGGRKQDAYDWLRENNHEDLIVETVNASTLKSFLRTKLKAGDEIPEELFKVTPYTRASIKGV